jgi:hypothetical protein
MRVEAAKARRALLLASGLLTLLAPVALGDQQRPVAGPRAEPAVSAAPSESGEPNALELNAPDLLGLALRVELAPGAASASAVPLGEAPEFPGAAAIPRLDVGPARAAVVAEPRRALLVLLTLVGAWGASRERRRFRALRRHP